MIQTNVIEIFKKNVSESADAKYIVEDLLKYYPSCRINFDLYDCDKILRLEGNEFDVELITHRLQSMGFTCEVLL